MIFWIEKKVLWTSKVKFSQSRKKSTFSKGVSPWFLSKNRPFSYVFFFSKKSQKETFFFILDSKECFLDPKSEILAKSKKSTFCKGVSPWFLSKNRPFSHMFFLSKKKARKKHFLIFWIENKAFRTWKVKFSQSRKKSTFCKGVSPWFFSTNRTFFHIFFFEPRKPEKNIFCYFGWKGMLFGAQKKSSKKL